MEPKDFLSPKWLALLAVLILGLLPLLAPNLLLGLIRLLGGGAPE